MKRNTLVIIFTYFVLHSCTTKNETINGNWINTFPSDIVALNFKNTKVDVVYRDGNIFEDVVYFNDKPSVQVETKVGKRMFQLLSYNKNDKLILGNISSNETYDTVVFRPKEYFTKLNQQYEVVKNTLIANFWKPRDSLTNQRTLQFLPNGNLIIGDYFNELKSYNVVSWELFRYDSIYFTETSDKLYDYLDLRNGNLSFKSYRYNSNQIAYIKTEPNKNILSDKYGELIGTWTLVNIEGADSDYPKSITLNVEPFVKDFTIEFVSGKIVMGNWGLNYNGDLILLDGLDDSRRNFFMIEKLDENSLTLDNDGDILTFRKLPI